MRRCFLGFISIFFFISNDDFTTRSIFFNLMMNLLLCFFFLLVGLELKISCEEGEFLQNVAPFGEVGEEGAGVDVEETCVEPVVVHDDTDALKRGVAAVGHASGADDEEEISGRGVGGAFTNQPFPAVEFRLEKSFLMFDGIFVVFII